MVLCLGLKGSGKSTLLAILSGESTEEIAPTVGLYLINIYENYYEKKKSFPFCLTLQVLSRFVADNSLKLILFFFFFFFFFFCWGWLCEAKVLCTLRH